MLAIRSDENESLAKTISMTTELQLTDEADVDEGEKPQERALVMRVFPLATGCRLIGSGLGVGISAGGMAKRGLAVDAVGESHTRRSEPWAKMQKSTRQFTTPL